MVPLLRTLALVLFVLVLGSGVGRAGANPESESTPASPPVQPGTTAADFAAALLTETNRVRREHGLQTLRPHPRLDAAADDQASLISLRLVVGHESQLSDQANPLARVRRRGVYPQDCSENAAALPASPDGQPVRAGELAARLVAAWMTSPPHRAALLAPNMTHLGGAVRFSRRPSRQWSAFGVQVFAQFSPREN
ncbi:CAP domain-containing protein [Opitutus sp. ER46]|uniref:CAP domain-containing protein n=1 Tax=Opitutus sp. ER46 TaxID=2161864 RepID=UPI000D3181A6|nr:CAP domain-containing protein [Opitutus sp. ER46]PTX98636.1 hypothetical protein DB354_05070 [Opitutus sp. ER46]